MTNQEEGISFQDKKRLVREFMILKGAKLTKATFKPQYLPKPVREDDTI